MKGLFFGNSHIGAIRSGYSIKSALDVDFYAVLGGGGPNVNLEGGRVYPKNQNAIVHSTIEDVQDEGLDLSGYDYIVFCSLGFSAVRDANKGNPLLYYLLAEFAKPGSADIRPVSRAVLGQVMRRFFYNQPAIKTLSMLKSQLGAQILCAPFPIPVVSELQEGDPLRRFYGASVADFTMWYSEFQSELVREFTDAQDINYLDYPEPTWVGAGSTPKEYVSPTDAWHMNSAYGRLVLDQVAAALS